MLGMWRMTMKGFKDYSVETEENNGYP